ncbi:MAG TPA: immune inhibitor A domain-containing protein [Nocardioidaceae bacterium]|nr:immune inhibitor A domain-containing protein [Nocardioidaceae bacterium]
MNRTLIGGIATLALVAAAPGVASADPPDRRPAAAPPEHGQARGLHKEHNLTSPLAEKQNALQTKAQEMVLRGQANPSSRGGDEVVKVAPGQYVELAREDEDAIWTVTGEFGDGVATHAHGGHGGEPGPLHNEIPKPDRDVDNTTIWTADFSEEYYDDLLYSQQPGEISMANYYIEQSSNRYTVTGDATSWVQVPNNAASYGSNYCGDIVCQDTWLFVDDSVDAWYQSQVDAGMSDAEIGEYLSQFDTWDRYDFDGDGNFDEPDGYIDHFQSVHAGVGEETGGGEQGTNAIWSHRWYVQTTPIGEAGPTLPDGTEVPLGGTEIGDSGYWIGDYTVEPENGGVGVFAHEFGHDLGLPDLYDTSGNTGGAENSTAFWTLMSSGSYGSSGEPEDGIGTEPMHMGNWEKFQLGWLDYEVVQQGERANLKLGPAEFNTKRPQGAIIVLPDKEVPLELGEPFAGENFYYSESGDNLDNTMTKEVTVPADGAFTAKVRYDIEPGWDYAYLTVNGESVQTNRSTDDNPNGQNFGNGITGTTDGEWVDLTADLSAYAGQTVTLGFRYWTDGAATYPGFQADQVMLGGELIGTAETDEGWTFDGFRPTTGSETQAFFNAYVLANRQYLGYDESLRTGPYNFGFLDTRPDWVEHFPYQDGLLINYWDTSYTNNNVGDHPGSGLILPVDAHPKIEHWRDGTMMRPRLQSYDSTFGLERTTALTLHNEGVPTRIKSKPAARIFDDSRSYWTECDAHACTGEHEGHYQPGWSSVDVPDTGTRVLVINDGGRGAPFMHLRVRAGR